MGNINQQSEKKLFPKIDKNNTNRKQFGYLILVLVAKPSLNVLLLVSSTCLTQNVLRWTVSKLSLKVKVTWDPLEKNFCEMSSAVKQPKLRVMVYIVLK